MGTVMSARLSAPMFGLVVAVLLSMGCGDGNDSSSESAADPTATATDTATATATPTATADPPAANEPVEREGSDAPREGVVSRAEAEKAAQRAVGSGRVTWSGPEDDRGAAWEIEVTKPNGDEVDVLIAADGSVIKQIAKQSKAEAVEREDSDPPPSSGAISRARAERAAVRAVGEGRVTWSGREDERGATWEVEVTRPDGSEVDVLIDARGRVVQ